MTQRRKSQSIGLLIIAIFSAVLLGALAAVSWPVPVVYADGPPEILTITVTSSLETYFHDPGLDSTGGTVYFNSVGGEGAGQVLTVTTIVSGSMPITLTGATAFGMTPIPDTNSSSELGITYTIGIGAGTENGVLFTVTDSVGFTDTALITFTQDNLDPTVEFTDVTNPDYDSNTPLLDELDDDGSNWYDPDHLSAGWYFTSTVTDTLSGLAVANASWDHANDDYDQLTYDPGLDGDGVFNDVHDDGDGMVTVTLTLTDHVGNSASDLVVLNLDDTNPTIISPTLGEDSNFLHADGFMLYYGDDMATAVFFWVEGEAQDDGSGPDQTTYSHAFEGTPTPDDLSPPSYSWKGYYNVDSKDYGSGTITVTVSDQVGNSATQIFTYAGDFISPTVVPITITHSSPYLHHTDGLTLYYSDRMSSSEVFEVQGTAADEGGAGFMHVTFPLAFGDSPDPDSNSPWSGIYYVDSSDNGDGNIVVTAYDNVSNWATGVFTYIEDTTNPTLTLTYVTPGGYDVDDPDDYLDADGSNWYKAGDFTPGGDWEFHYNTADDGAGLASGSAFWDHSNDVDDQQIPELDLDGDDVFNGVDDDGDGVVTVTLTITDHVANLANGVVVLNIDNTGPVITSPSIYDYESPWLHVNGLNVYYGNDMPGPQSFRVQGESTDGTGVGLDRATFSEAFGNPPPFEDTTPITWTAHYYPDDQNWGNGTITVTVYDLLDNPATQVFTYTRDTANPTSVASSPQYDNGDPIVVAYSNATDTGGSGLQGVELWYKKEVTGTWADSGLSPQTGPSGSFNFTPTDGDGTYYFASVATDNVGNQETAPTGSGDDETLYDTVEPSVPENFAYQPDSDSGGDGFPPEAGYYDDTTIDLEWDPSTDNGSGLLTPPYHLGTAPQPTGGPYPEDSSYNVGSSGTYSLYLTAEDNAGNISDDAVTGPVVVDTQAPQGSMNCPGGTAQKWFTVSWSATDQGPAGLRSSDPYSVWYKVDGGGWQDWIIGTSAVMATFGPDSPVTVEYDHTYCFRMRAVDKAGNVWTSDGNDCTEVSGAYPSTTKVFLPIIMTADPNWGFELGDFTRWQHGGQLAQSVSTAMSYSGNYSALLGSPSYSCNNVPVGSAWLRRSVTVPSSGSPTLSFYYRIFTQDKTTPGDYDKLDLFAVYINGSDVVVEDANITSPPTCGTPYDLYPGWKYVSFSLEPYKGQTIEITFYNYNRAEPPYNYPEKFNTYTYVDDVSVQ